MNSRLLSFAILALSVLAPGAARAVCQPQPECEANNTPPTVTLTSPSNGATTTAPGTFTLSANAVDDSAVDSVEFFSNNVSVGVDSSAPYSMLLSGLAAGSYQLKAKATDDTGKTASSTIATVTVTVPSNAPPTVSLTSPSNGATGAAPASFTLSATAADSDGSIASVKFLNGASILATDTSYPYSFSWTSVAAGTYSITAVATDNGGATTTSSSATVTVSAASNASPTIALTAPGNGNAFSTSTPFTLSATAPDSDVSLADVKFYIAGGFVAPVSAAPYTYSYSTATPGSYAISAVATDNAGSSTTSSTATVTVTAPGMVSETRRYVYDAQQRLCKTINPESGATVIDYDAAGNIAWTADGLNLPSTTSCDRNLVNAAEKTTRTYDDLNRVTQVTTPGGTANVARTYYADGQVNTLTAANPGGANVVTTYTYNKRRLLTSERQLNGTTDYTVAYGYSANGHLSAIGYPDNEQVTYSPDALGRPTQVVGTSATYATAIVYYPNGAMSSFKYGPGGAGSVQHSMIQNARQLPSRSQDMKGTTAIVDDTYTYDANGNVSEIWDRAQNLDRQMTYDGLDRLRVAVSDNLATSTPNDGPWGVGTYSYDALDNLRTADQTQGARTYRYNYDTTTWRLTGINNAAGTSVFTFGYDSRGNVINKSGQLFAFDASNRMSSAATISGTAGNQTYRYDGLGRRVQTTDPATGTPPTQPTTFYVYSREGQILYASEARNSVNRSYIYLNGSQIATRTKAWAPVNTVTVRYQMTDALGSPVASIQSNNQISTIQRTAYTPWGEATPSVDGSGYTGHVMDANTGLTYMQQRYYDAQVGRFASTDPAESEFNRFNYAANNPYRFKDVDGRAACPGVTDGSCIRSDTFNEENFNVKSGVASTELESAFLASQSSVAVPLGHEEKMGFIVVKDGSLQFVPAASPTAGTDGHAHTIGATNPEGMVAVTHGHIDESDDPDVLPSDGLVDKVGGIGDARPLLASTPKPVATVSQNRVGVHELVNGQLQFRMIQGSMTTHELEQIQANLNFQQSFFNAPAH